MQSLYELEFKRSFVKVAESRAVCLRECPLRELLLYSFSSESNSFSHERFSIPHDSIVLN